MVIVDSDDCAYFIDMNDGVETLICASVRSGYVKLTSDCRFFFCLLSDEDEHDWNSEPKLFCLDIDRNTKSIYSWDCIFGTSSYQYASEFETCNESGFLLGDPFWLSDKGFPFVDFALVLEKQMLIRVSPFSKVIEMCRLNDVREWRCESGDEAGQSIEPGDITTKRAENNDLTEHNLPEINNMPEDGFVKIDYFESAVKVYFSVDGDSLYTVTDEGIQIINLVAGDVLSKRIRKKKCMIPEFYSVVPVKRGVLLQTDSYLLELWNSELSVCMKRWTVFPISKVVPLSEERVALEKDSELYERWEVIILDTTSEKIVSTIPNDDNYFLACNDKLEVLTAGFGSLMLCQENQFLWITFVQEPLYYSSKGVLFSPTGEYIVTYGELGSYVLDAVSGKVIRQSKNMDVDDVKFISNEDCIVCFNYQRAFALRLYNVKSGDLLSEIVEQRQFRSLAVYPRKRLVAIGFQNSKDHFEIIQAKLPGDKEKTNIERSVETKFI